MINQYLLDSKSTQIGEHAMAGAISVINYAEKSTRFLFSNNLGTSAHHQNNKRFWTISHDEAGPRPEENFMPVKFWEEAQKTMTTFWNP